MYEFHPVTLSARADYVKFTPEIVEKLSPQRHLDKLVAPVVVTHGTPLVCTAERESTLSISCCRGLARW